MVQINLSGLDAAIKCLLRANGALDMYHKQLAALDPTTNRDVMYEHPKTLEERRERVRKAFAEHLDNCKKLLREQMAGFRRHIVDCAIPKGENLRNEDARGDLYLLEHNLIDTPAELESMRKRNLAPFNPAVLRAIDHYAADKARKWPGFEFAVEVDALDAACDALEELAKRFFADPEHSNIDAVLKNASGEQYLQFVKGGNE